MKISDVCALVTRGASGLGEATARRLAFNGANVAILDFNADRANEVATDIGSTAIQVDISDEKSVAVFHKTMNVNLFGTYHVMSHAAKIGSEVPFPQRLGEPDEFALMVQEIIENRMSTAPTFGSMEPSDWRPNRILS